MDIRDTDFILNIIHFLLDEGELAPELYKAMKSKNINIKPSVLVKPDVLRIAAIHTAQKTFENLLTDGADDYIMKIKALPFPEKGPRYLDVDAFMDIMQEPWQIVRHNLEEHALYLYQEYCTIHRVLQDGILYILYFII